jgi:hypothetical protein
MWSHVDRGEFRRPRLHRDVSEDVQLRAADLVRFPLILRERLEPGILPFDQDIIAARRLVPAIAGPGPTRESNRDPLPDDGRDRCSIVPMVDLNVGRLPGDEGDTKRDEVAHWP